MSPQVAPELSLRQSSSPVPPSPRHIAAHYALSDALCFGGDAMPYTVAEAAKAIGKSKPTILRRIRTGADFRDPR